MTSRKVYKRKMHINSMENKSVKKVDKEDGLQNDEFTLNLIDVNEGFDFAGPDRE